MSRYRYSIDKLLDKHSLLVKWLQSNPLYYTCLKLVQQLRSTGVATKIPGPAIDLEAQDLTDALDVNRI